MISIKLDACKVKCANGHTQPQANFRILCNREPFIPWNLVFTLRVRYQQPSISVPENRWANYAILHWVLVDVLCRHVGPWAHRSNVFYASHFCHIFSGCGVLNPVRGQYGYWKTGFMLHQRDFSTRKFVIDNLLFLLIFLLLLGPGKAQKHKTKLTRFYISDRANYSQWAYGK